MATKTLHSLGLILLLLSCAGPLVPGEAAVAAASHPTTMEPSSSSSSARRALVPRTDRWAIFDIGSSPRAEQGLLDLGVGWARVQLRLGEKGWTNKLSRIRQMARTFVDDGIGIWLTVYHRDPGNVIEDGTVGYDNTERGGFAPRDAATYQALVQRGVGSIAETIRSRGVDPADWLIVQFGNEVAPNDVFPPDRPSRFWHGTSDQFLDMLALGYDAVKAVDPGIEVSLPGISSAAMELVLDNEPAAVQWNRRLLREGAGEWADIHLRHELSTVRRKVRWVDKRWDGRLAATEIAGPDPRVATWSEEAQADELTPRMRKATRGGVDRAFWAALVDNPTVEPAASHEGLIQRDPWRRKPAFDVYQELIAEDGL